jgi:hypothetical protein
MGVILGGIGPAEAANGRKWTQTLTERRRRQVAGTQPVAQESAVSFEFLGLHSKTPTLSAI